MTVGTSPVDPVVADLLERLALVSDVEEGGHVVLGQVLQILPLDRVLLAVMAGERVGGAAYGIDDDSLRAFLREAGEEDSSFRTTLESADPRVVRHPSHFPELSFSSYVIIPFPGPAGDPVGALLVEGDRLESVEPVAQIMVRCGPTLSRVIERQVARDRHARIHRHATLLDTAVDALVDPVVLTDGENNFLFANRRADTLFSAAPDESEGRRRAIEINDLIFTSYLTEATIGGESTRRRELNLVDPSDGSDLLFEVFSFSVSPSGRQDRAVLSVLRDITDLRSALSELEVQFSRSRVAEQSARRESERLNAIIGSVGDPILVTDAESRIILMNDEAERLFEAPENGGGGKRGRAVRNNDTKFTTLISDVLLQTDKRSSEKLVLTDPDTGSELPVEVVSTKVLNERGEVTALVNVVHDLTQVVENERLARELQSLNESLEERIHLATQELEERNQRLRWQSRELEKASRLKSEFLASMSHELRTPINAMLGYTSLLREQIYGELNDRQEQALQKIYGASQHLLALINDILDLSKIEAGKMPVTVEEVRIEPIIKELAQTVEPMLRDKPVELRTEMDDDLPLLHTDRTKVKQILLNLLTNAVKFTAEGWVSVRASRVDGFAIRLEIEDTGIGIPDDKLDAIFQDFRQVDQSATRKYPGTGLGLSITRKLLTLLEGQIEVESEYGSGTRFVVVLPVELEKTVDPDAAPPSPAELEGRPS